MPLLGVCLEQGYSIEAMVNILERAKVARKNPSMTNPQYEKTIIKTDSQVGEYILYTGSISYAPPVDISNVIKQLLQICMRTIHFLVQ